LRSPAAIPFKTSSSMVTRMRLTPTPGFPLRKEGARCGPPRAALL
jgi:hypothetical protein